MSNEEKETKIKEWIEKSSTIDVAIHIIRQEEEIKELKDWKEKQLKMVASHIPEHEKQTSSVKLTISMKGVIAGEAKCYDDDMNVAWDKTTEIIKKVQDLNKDTTGYS